jgi:serine/threonine-protein kinase
LPQIPGYVVLEVLGHGGMGVVYKARHLRLDRTVALKMLLAGGVHGPEHRERFAREAAAVAGLRHPNIVQVHDMGEHNGQPYFTMEFVEGGNLAQKLAGTPQSPRQAAELSATLAAAVQAAHQSGIVHRDLKPANVLLAADGTPRISDFGLARRLDGETGLTRTGTAVGTPGYMAPEQAEAGPLTVGPAVDIYALGAILYELLTGRPPFRAETAAATVRQVISQDPVPPSRLNGKVPRDLETICLKCLQKEPRLRYTSTMALAEDLHRFLSGEAITARPDGGLARLARRVLRRPVWSLAIAIGTLLTVALLGGGLWLISDRAAVARRVEAERTATDQAAEEDLQEMARWLRKSTWLEAQVALERARGRLGEHGSAELRRLLDQGTRDLELAARLEATRMDTARGILAFDLARSDEQYEEAFRGAGIGRPQDDPEVVADRIRTSNIRNALVAALDDWSAFTTNPRRKNWVLAVARKGDPDPTGWRDRARDPVIRTNETALVGLMKTAPVADPFVPLFLALDRQLKRESKERLPFLKRIHREHPDDFWLNHALGEVLLRENRPEEAVGYYQAAVSIRPRTAISHHILGHALLASERREEAIRHLRLAAELEPTYFLSHQLLAFVLSGLGRYAEAVDQLRVGIRFSPNEASIHTALGQCLEALGRNDEALAEHRQAVALDPKNGEAQGGFRTCLAQMGRGDEAVRAWESQLEAGPARHADWDGYAEYCVFIGREEEYRRARRGLLASFGTSTDPLVAEKTARACLLLPATEEELRRTVALAGRAEAIDRSKHPGEHASFLVTRGLAEYRQGRFDRAISTMRRSAAQVSGPASSLILALALHRSGRPAEARKTLAAAIVSHDWRTIRVRDRNDWFIHILRREAERLILPDLPAFLDGKHQPRDNDERLALLGVCQFTNRTLALARLYADSFAEAPPLAKAVGPIHRYAAARSAAMAGSGLSPDGGNLSEAERTRWRKQARDGFACELAAWAEKLNGGTTADRRLVWWMLSYWRADPDLARVRERDALDRLSAPERDEWLALWTGVDALFNRTTSP